ncbi:bifunctional enoyl-CoA hydratase/phosphate acetyltransferase [Iodobacter sp. HSC-16F04]|uniref:Bifunctional enoyl-CoA hydratase/phosphate acetyltransferase n=1 Tax=Iodobacter violaceini TaxID=3044271 RepID=A0ABX0KZR8_9NEIS|nr:bifunctional enoyl-CoA hydratase/phosphate acetyltransferase [Iodobacter violacea]NHQ87982.1 bifunctional enoyl-CoA hydratase/phosphate acetyltransferase [Iodobacter violacea]
MITLQNRCFDEIEIGDYAGIQHTLAMRDIQLFATVAGDFNPTHLEAAFASNAGFSGATAPGMWLGAQVSGILGSQLPGPGTVYAGQSLQFHTAAILGDTLEISITVREKFPEDHTISFDCLCLNQHGQTIMTGVAKVVAPTEKITLVRPDAGLVSVQTHNAFELLLERCDKLPTFSAAIAHPCDESSLKVAIDAAAQGLLQPVLVGPKNKILAVAEQYGLNIAGLRIEDVPHSHAAASRAVELVTSGEALILMKGSLHTDELMSAVVKSSLRTERRISHVFIMDVPTYHKTLLVTDAAINIYPDLLDKLDICQNAIDLAHVLGIAKPKVAILSAVETINPKILSTLDAASLCKMADRGQITGAVLDGPLALDNAISYESARIKKIESIVAGDADILLVPDLEAGNILAKQLTFMSNADAAGIVLGARVPIILTSRADNDRTKLASCAIACIITNAHNSPPPC